MGKKRKQYKPVDASLQTAKTALTAWRRVFLTVFLVVCFALVSTGVWAAVIETPYNMNPDNTVTINDDRYTLGITSSQHAFYSSSGGMWINTNGNVIFDGTGALNAAITRGSLIFNDTTAGSANIYLGTTGGNVTVENFITADGASSTSNGGAIFSVGGEIKIGNANGTVMLRGNRTDGVGAAVFIVDDPADVSGYDITIDGKTIRIEDNRAGMHSGAIFTGNGNILAGNQNTDEVVVSNNTAGGSGGALQASGGTVTVRGKEIELTGNTTTGAGGIGSHAHGSGGGGAILGSYGVYIGGAETNIVTIKNNHAIGKGGAIYTSTTSDGSDRHGSVIIQGKEIKLIGNSAGVMPGSNISGGGAIYTNKNIILTGDEITIEDNFANTHGGALEAAGNVTITGSVTATGNYTEFNITESDATTHQGGGAIWAGGDVTLNATGNSSFIENIAGGTSYGGAIRAGGTVTLNATGGDITFEGNTASDYRGQAIWFDNQGGDKEAVFHAASGRTITFYDTIDNDEGEGLLTVNKTGMGTVVFDGINGNDGMTSGMIYGNTTVEAGIFVVRNDAVYGLLQADIMNDPAKYTGYDGATELTSFTVNPDATLAGGIWGEVRADEITLLGTLNISGSGLDIKNHPAAGNASGGFSTFNLVGGNIDLTGSKIFFNTYLNNGSQELTDMLIINEGNDGGTTTGAALIFVRNVNGPGGLTTTVDGSGNEEGEGIKLVETYGTSDATFELGYPVVSGIYEYTLEQGTLDGYNSGDWYLRSRDNLREETSHYPPLAPMALLYGRSLIGTLHERVGDEEDIRGRKDLHEKTPKTGGWARIIGNIGKQDGDLRGGFYGDTPEYKYNFFGAQVGQDLYRSENDKGKRNHLGFSLGYGRAKGTSTHVDGAHGNNKFDAYTLGGYWTHFGDKGGYIDTVLQGTYYDNMTSSRETGRIEELDTHAWGIAASIEGGKPFRNDKGWFVEPQAQLIYQYIDISSARDAGAQIIFDDVESLVGRIGARFGRAWMADEVRQVTVWVRPNIWHEFLGDSVTKFSSGGNHVPFNADLGGTTGEINVGFNGQMSPTVTLYVNASYTVRFDGDGHGYHGQAGLRWNW